jgi:hypothetical protein
MSYFVSPSLKEQEKGPGEEMKSLLPPVPAGFVHSEIRPFTHSEIPEMSICARSSPGAIPGVENPVIIKP